MSVRAQKQPQALDPVAAAQLLESFDAAVEQGRPWHRVSGYFCGHGRGSLRADLEQHARGDGLTVRLRREIHSYMACRLDDTVSESPHRDVSYIAGRARCSKIPWWSASVRLRQNLALAAEPCHRAAIDAAWPIWKTLASEPGSTKVPKMRQKPFLDAVHRVGGFGLVDCSRIRAVDHRDVYTVAFQARESSLPTSARTWRNFRREFVNAVITDGQVYTATIRDTESGPPDSQTMATASAASHRAAAQVHFRALDCAVAAKKHNLTLRWLHVKSMAMPVSLQKLSATSAGAGGVSCPEQVTLVPDGEPVIVDLLAFLPWETIRGALQEWSTVRASSGGGGSVDVSSPIPVAGREWVLTEQSTPMVVLVDTLLARGWRAVAKLAQCPKSYSMASATGKAMVFPLQHLRPQWKPYFQCLLSLEALAARGLTELPAHEKPAYYRAVLASPAPAGVAAAGADGPGIGQATASTAAASAAPVDVGPGELSDEPLPCHFTLPVAPSAVAAAPSVSVSAAAPASPCSDGSDLPLRPQPATGRPAQDSAGDEAFTGLWHPEQLLRPRSRSRRQDHRGRAPSRSSSARRRRSAAGASGSGSGSGGNAGMAVDGVPVRVDEHIGVRDAYRRLVVKCPWHPNCTRRRNTGARQTERLGELEPLWYLGAWLSRGQNFLGRDDHMAYIPSADDVRQYGESGAWWSGVA